MRRQKLADQLAELLMAVIVTALPQYVILCAPDLTGLGKCNTKKQR